MQATKRIVIDLLSGGYSEPAHVVQGDAYSRAVELDIRQEKTRWTIPNGLAVVVEYHKPDGTKGVYDTLPDGTRAWSAEGNILTLQLAPQMLTAPGTVVTQVRMLKGDAVLSLFKFHVFVHQRIAGGMSEDYINLNTFLPQVEGAKVGQYFEVAEVDDAGRATKIIAVDAPQGGAVDIPTKLPNPHVLTFTGAVNATYDGSEAVSVEIPQGGGGGGKYEHIATFELVPDVLLYVQDVSDFREVSLIPTETGIFSGAQIKVSDVPIGPGGNGQIKAVGYLHTFRAVSPNMVVMEYIRTQDSLLNRWNVGAEWGTIGITFASITSGKIELWGLK